MRKKLLYLFFLFITFSVFIPRVYAADSVADRILVKWKTTDITLKQTLLNQFQAQIEGQIYGIPIDKVKVPANLRDQLLTLLKNNPAVLYAEPDYIAHGQQAPNDYTASQQYYLGKINAPSAWDITHATNQVVAVLDSGLDMTHPDIQGKVAANGYDFVNNDNDPTDDLNHGTFVSGIIGAATNNGGGIAATGYDTKILPIKVLDSQNSAAYSNIASGINWAVNHGVKIINISIVGTSPDVTLQNTVDTAWNNGAIIVAAAGNDGTTQTNYPASYTNVLSVTGSNENDQKWSDSNCNVTVDLAAPGTNILSLIPSNGYGIGSGTSFASPQVAATAALVKAKNPTWTNTQVRAAIENNADNVGVTCFNHGRLNSLKAVLNGSPTPTPSTHHADTIGTFRSSAATFFLRNSNTQGVADMVIQYGIASDKVVVGDWNGDGKKTVGIYRNGVFYIKNTNGGGNADLTFPFGANGDLPVAGDWNGDGVDTIGVFRNGSFFLKNSNSSGNADIVFNLGTTGDIPLAGDWNGDHIDTAGVFRPTNGNIFLRNTNTSGVADITIVYGLPNDKPVTGDWDGNGTDTIGVYRNGNFYLKNSNTSGNSELSFSFGTAGDAPIAGDWDGNP